MTKSKLNAAELIAKRCMATLDDHQRFSGAAFLNERFEMPLGKSEVFMDLTAIGASEKANSSSVASVATAASELQAPHRPSSRPRAKTQSRKNFRKQGIPEGYEYELYRIRKEKYGSETEFREEHFGGKYPFRAEVAFASLQELQEFKKTGRLIGVRIRPINPTPGKRTQVNIVGIKNIKGL